MTGLLGPWRVDTELETSWRRSRCVQPNFVARHSGALFSETSVVRTNGRLDDAFDHRRVPCTLAFSPD
ncbi:MAG: hypothetical protein D6691_06935 [Candidatus Hydrogenedentota bacterium]|nr:MAG: hypothetical protein D6691_06935 [Candidatus Hydrogenedentota bacterium]GIX43950.1 MAG: hypothetical protein KatS3mg130_0358 [Candidatus Sumerlaea sp.]